MLAGHHALTIAAIFTGAALYISFAEQLARLELDDKALLSQWKPSYKRGFAMQAPLAALGCLCGLIAWWQTSAPGFLAGAVLIVANWPWTLIGMTPTNSALMTTEPADATARTRQLVMKRGALHGVRSALGVQATAAFVWAVTSG